MRFPRSLASGVVAGALILLGLGCGGDTPTDPTPDATPSALVEAGGNAQSDTVGQVLATQLGVRVTDAAGASMPDVAVTWTVTSGGGSVSGGSRTGADGVARTTWTLGTTVGQQSVTATVAGVAQARVFTATASHDRPATIVVTPDSVLLDAVGDSAKPVITVRDRYNNAIATPVLGFAVGSTVATVGASGFVRATGAGRVIMTITSDTASKAVPVRVDPLVTALGLALPRGGAASCFTALGDTTTATVAPVDRNGNAVSGATITWLSRDTAVASVSGAGLVTSKKNGTSWVVAQAATSRAAKADSVQVCVTQAVVRVEASVAADTINAIGHSRNYSAAAYDARGSAVSGATFSWSTSAASVASVTTTGTVTAAGTGAAQIVVSSGAAKDTIPVLVRQVAARVVVTPQSDTLVTGTTATFQAQAFDSAGAQLPSAGVRWTSRATGTVRVDSLTGVATGVAAGQAYVLATHATVASARDSVNVLVTPVPVGSVRITPDSTSLIVGDTATLAAQALDAGGQPLAGRTFTWSTLTSSIVTVSATGAVTAVGAGRGLVVASSEGRSDTAVVQVGGVGSACADIAHTLGTTANGNWTAGDCRDFNNAATDRYVFTATAQEHFRATVNGTAGRQLRLRAQGSTQYIGFMPRAITPETNPVAVDYLLKPGTYVLEVSAPDSATLGSYSLTTARQTSITCSALTFATAGVEVAGTLANGDCLFNGALEDFLLFNEPTGTRLQATLTSTGFRPVIAIKDDRSLASPVLSREYRSTAGVVVQTSWTTRFAGSHEVIVTSFGAGETGSYTLRVDAVDAANTCVATPYTLGNFTQAGWESSDCRTSDAKAYDRYQVAGATTAFRSNVAGVSGKALEVMMDGVSVGRTRAWADTSLFRTHWFVKAGSLELRPIGPNAGGDSATMTYTLSSIADTNITSCRDVWMQRGAAIPGQTLSATDCTFQNRSEDRILLRLAAGETFTVSMTSAEFAPLLAFRNVLAAPGTVLVRDMLSAPGTARVSWTATADGVYEIIFTSAAESIAGSYTVGFPSSLASLALTPDTLSLVTGDTASLAVTLRDTTNAVITGPRVSWISRDTAVAMVDSTGLVTARASGSAWIHASAEGRADSSLVQVASAMVATVTVAPSSLSLLVGDTATLKAMAMSADADTLSGRAVSWTSADTTVATVDTAGLVTARGAGQVEVVATIDGVSDSATVTVGTRPVGTLTLSPDTLAMAARDSARLTLALADDRGTAITGRVVAWSSADTAIAVVNDSGWVTGRAEGTVVVTAESEGVRDSSVVIVGAVPVARVSMSPDSSATVIGGTRQLSAIAEAAAGDTLAGRTFTWVSLDTAIASVDPTGLVTGRALGTARITVASGGKADTAKVTVKSPYSRIAIAPDTVTLTAVGQTQAYLATAYDTAGAAVSGVSFTWSIANPLVGSLDATVGQGVTATAEGPGVTQLFATANGMTGAASLRVGQYAATVNASPDTVRLAVGGRATLSAEARDANDAVMPGATVRWKAANSFARVDSTTGEVTAMSLGVGKIVARLYNPTDTVVSDTVQVVVANDAPPSLTFGANVFTVGRNAGVSIPIYLSTAPTAPVTLRLVSGDTAKGKFSAQYLTFSAGQTQQNAYFTATQIGSVAITATDTAGTFGTDGATVQINITSTLTINNGQRYSYHETNQYYPTANQYDVLSTELRLSDPAPAGGLYFTITSGSHVTADPQTVFVPAGQLATTFTLTAAAPGSGSITASAAGTTSASALLRVMPATFVFPDINGTGRLRYTIGVGQTAQTNTGGYHVNMDAGTTLLQGLPITYSISAPSVISQPTAMTMPAGQKRVIVPFTALAEGRVLLSATAPGWNSETDTIIVTRPKVVLSNSSYGDSTFVGVQRGSMYATLTDSAGRFHPAADTVRFQLWSGDTNVVKVESSAGMILPGQSMPPGQYLYMQAVGGGTTYIYSGAPGYITDSIRIRVKVPKIVATGWNNRVTASGSVGYVAGSSLISVLASPRQRSWVTFTSSDTLVASVDSVYFDPSGGGYPTVTVPAHVRSRVAGTATIIVSAPNHEPDTIQVVSNAGRVRFNNPRPQPLQMFQVGTRIFLSAYDSLGASTLTALDTTLVTVTVLDPSIVRMDTTEARFLPGEPVNKSFPIVPVNVGTTKLILQAPNVAPDTLTVNITGPQLSVGGYRNALATNQTTTTATATGISVTIPSPRTVPVVVQLSRRNPAISTLSADSVTIPAGQTSASFGWASGSVTGVDTIFAMATGYAPDTMPIQVRAPKLLPGYFSGAFRPTMPAHNVNVAVGMVGDQNPVGATTIPVTVYVTSSDPSVMVADSAAIHVQPGETYRQVSVRFISPGTARLIFTDSAGSYAADSSNLATVVAPVISYETGQFNWKLGMLQQSPDSLINVSYNAITSGVFVTVEDTVRGAPLVIAISSSDPRVVSVPATVTIPVGGKRAFLRLVAGDTTGAIAVYATADGFIQGRRDVDVLRGMVGVESNAAPDLRYNSSGTMYVTLRDSSNTTENETAVDLVLEVTSSNPSVVSVDSATVTVPAGTARMQWDNFLNYHAVGTATITLTDPRTGFVRYIGGSKTINVQDTTP